MLRSFRSLLLLAAAAAALAVAGCDSGTPPNEVTDEGVTTVQFADDALSALEAETPTVDLPVEIDNPSGHAVTVQVLVAFGASSEGFEPADLGLSTIEEERAFRDGGTLTAYVLDDVTFPADAEDGDTQTVSVSIADSLEEGQENAVFVLQSARSEGGGTVSLGGMRQLTLTIEAEGTETLVEEDFAGAGGAGELGVFSAVSVASSANWAPSSAGSASNVPYASINGFGADEASNDWLISPALDFSSVAAETLTFLNAKNFDDSGVERGLLVKVSADYDGSGNPEDFTWTDLSDLVTYSEGGYEFVSSGELNLEEALPASVVDAPAVYVAFQYLSSGTGGGSSEAWEVDDIVLTGRSTGAE